MPNTRTSIAADLASILVLTVFVALASILTWLPGCDSGADAGVRRDQLGSDVRAGGYDEDLESHVRSRSTSVPRFNAITTLSLPPSPTASGSITLQASGSPSTASVELADGVATCLETGETLDRPHLIGADLSSGALSLESEFGTMTCAATHETGNAAGRPHTYSLWVGDIGP